MQQLIVFVILALAGVYLWFRFRRAAAGGSCPSCAKKKCCASACTQEDTQHVKRT